MSLRESIAALFPFVRGPNRQRGLPNSFAGFGTVMMWDLAGFGSLEDLSPEELLSLMHQNASVCARSIEESSGQIVQSIGDAGLALWLPSHLDPPHAVLAFRCGASICKRLSQLPSRDIRPKLRVSLGTGPLAGGLMMGRPQIFGVACVTAKRLLGLDLPRRTSMLYTSETLALVEGEIPRTEPVARFTRTTGEEVEVYEYRDYGA